MHFRTTLIILLFLSASLLIGCIERGEESVNTPPMSSLSVSPFPSGYAPYNVTFYINAKDSDGYIVSWSLDVNNDGIPEFTGSGDELPKMINYTYTTAGNYTAKLIVTDNNGGTDESIVTITVLKAEENNPPICSVSANVTQGYAPLKVAFKANVEDDGYIVKYTWDFGDGATSNQKDPSHIFTDAGVYNVTLTVEDNGGLTATAYILIEVLEQQEWQPEYGVKYRVHVVTVIDGDTFDAVFPNGSIERVRLLGVDCPEKNADDNKLGEYDDITDLKCLAYWGIEAMNFAKSWLEGKDVYIEFDELAGFKGYYGRWLCYVYLLNDTDFNAELIKRGLARVYEEGTCSKERYYLTLQQQAIDAKVGLWGCMPESGGVVILTVHYDAAGNDWDNLNDEYVVIKNEGNEAVDMTGWTLSDEANHVYTFPPGFILGAGATVTVYTGSGTDMQDKLYWGNDSPIWNNDGDTAYLRDNEGNLVDSWS